MASLTGMTLVELTANKSERISNLLQYQAIRRVKAVKSGRILPDSSDIWLGISHFARMVKTLFKEVCATAASRSATEGGLK